MHLERKLAGSLLLKGPQSSPLRLQLQPWGTITGRIVDAQGKPIGNARIEQSDLPRYLLVKDPNGEYRRVNESYVTDGDGRFRIEGLAPRMRYSPWWIWDQPAGKYLDCLKTAVTVEAGQTKDLGDLKMKRLFVHEPSTWRSS